MKYLLLILLTSCANHRSMECVNDNIGNCILSLKDSDGKIFITDIIHLSDDPEVNIAYTGWPSEPHTICNFYIAEGINWIRTDKGYSPADVYFKLI